MYKISKAILRKYGLKDEGLFFSSTYHERVMELKDLILENAIISAIGEYGMGKTGVVSQVISELKSEVTFVKISNYLKQRITIGNVIDSVLDQFNIDKRRDVNAKSVQFQTAVGEHVVDAGKRLCVIIDQGHELHKSVFKALKDAWEYDFAGQHPLFSILVIGHRELNNKLNQVPEFGKRSHKVFFDEKHGWMTKSERIDFLEAVYSSAIKETARERIASVESSMLGMKNYVEQKMVLGLKLGKNVLDDEIVKPSNRDLYETAREQYNTRVSQRKIAAKYKEMYNEDISPAKVNALLDDDTHGDSDKLSKAISSLVDDITIKVAKAV